MITMASHAIFFRCEHIASCAALNFSYVETSHTRSHAQSCDDLILGAGVEQLPRSSQKWKRSDNMIGALPGAR